MEQHSATLHHPAALERVAVVVIGRNEGQRLVDCLSSLGKMIAKTVYVDSGSNDGSVERARRLGATVVTLDPGAPFSAARARNLGFRHVMNDAPDSAFVQFVDGDCQLHRDWIATATKFLLLHPEVALVCGHRRERHPEASIYNAMCDQEWDGPIGPIEECGGDFLSRVESFRKVGGFRDDLIAGEEPELCIRLRENGWGIWRIAQDMTLHDANILHFSQWWRRTVRGGHAYAQIEALHRYSAFPLWRRNVQRALFWGGLAPIAIALSVAFEPWILALLAVYPLQWVRLFMRRGYFTREGFMTAGLLVIGKLAELQGIATFHMRRLRRRKPALIEYK